MDITAYLGDFADDLTDEQKDTLAGVFDVIAAKYSGEDDELERQEATSAAAQIAFGDATATEFAEAWRRAKAAERVAMAELTGAIIATVAPHGDWSENEAAAELGLNRRTIRRALGK